MKEAIKKEKKISLLIGRFLLWLPGLLLVCFLVLFSVLQMPSIQTKIINSVSEFISSKTTFKIQIDYANLTWYDKMVFENIEILDSQDSVLMSVGEAKLNLSFVDFVIDREINVDELIISDLILNVVKSTDSTEVNINQFIKELVEALNKKNKPKSNISVGKVILKNAQLSFNDLRKQPLIVGKDYYHFGMDSVQATFNNFTQVKDTINFSIEKFHGNDISKQLNIKSLEGEFFFCRKSMSLYQFVLQTDLSTLNDSLTLFYDSPSSLKYFVDSVKFYSSMDRWKLHTNDIALFAQSLKNQNQEIHLSGQFKGLVKRFSGKKVAFSFGRNTSIFGELSFSGLPKIKETFIDLNVKESNVDARDIIDFVPEKFQQRVLNTGIVDFEGQFMGFLTDFVANGIFNTHVGYLQSDVNMKISDSNLPLYSGNLVLKEFDLGKFLSNRNLYQNVNLKGNIIGSGLEVNNAKFFLNAKIDSIGIRNYIYKDIVTNGEFANQFFEGDLTVKDPNLKFSGFTTIDLRGDKAKFNFRAQLDTLLLQPLGFSNQNICIATSIDADVKGSHIDSINGYANLRHLEIKRNKQHLSIDSLKLLSFLIGGERVISLETDGMTGELKGNYQNSTVIKNVKLIIAELALSAINNSDSIDRYYTQKNEDSNTDFSMNIELNLWDINRFLQPFFPDLKLSKKIVVDGFFKSDEVSRLQLYTFIDSIYYKNNLFVNNDLDIEVSKLKSSKNILSSLFVDSKEQFWNEKSKTENFYVESIWLDNQIDITANLEQSKFSNKANLRAVVNFLKDTISFSFLNSEIHALNKDWEINLDNRIAYTDSAYHFRNVGIENGEQSISINGILSRKPKNRIKVDLSNFSIGNFNSLIPIELKGDLDGEIEVNYLDNDLLVESDLKLTNLYMEEYLVGDINCLSEWENDKKRLNLSFETLRNGKKIMDIAGHFYPKNTNNQIDMVVEFDSANLDISQPFLKSQFDNLRGYASGKFNITGNPSSPILKGVGALYGGAVNVKYLNTNYTFNGGLVFDENEISVKNLTLYDVENDSAVFNGGVFHDGFRDFVLDIKGKFNHFKMLNTTSVDNKLYYGTAFASGEIDFLGTITNLQINAKTKTEKGTRISIPIGELSEFSLESKEYINFVELNPIEKVIQNKVEEVNLKGIKLDFDIEMTNDAYIELIFDVTAGDIIRGRGNGNLNLQINTNGDFNMFGDFEIEKGGYNFTLYNIINKEFEIHKGSQISWYGDPYGANLNIQADYRQLASLSPMITEYNSGSTSDSPEVRRKYPSIVNLGITGKLLNPDIKFDIDIEDYPNNITTGDGIDIPLQTIISAFKTKLAQNEQEMKRQVFSLVILKKFSPENSFSVNSNTIGNSLSEFVSNQLSYWATQVDENLEIDVNLAGLDADAFNTFQLRLSYTFLDGRLRVTRGGGFSNIEKQNNASAIIGDWTIEYLLTNDGRFRAKMYSRTNLNSINSQLSNNKTETGFSLQYIRSFDELRRILSDKRNESKTPQNSSNSTNGEAVLPKSSQDKD